MNAKNRPFSLSIFFPAYNEEANIATSIAKASEVAKQITDRYEIIVVNDGSKDKTGAIAETLAKKDPRVRVIHHNPNRGYGSAVWSGIQASRYDYVFFTDADLQFNLQELKKLVAYIPKYKVVLGYRARRKDPFMRLVNAKGWNILNRLLFGLKVRDIDCAFKLMERKLLVDLPIKSRGAMMSAELLIHLQRQGVAFKEVPVTHLPRTAGSPTGAKPSVILRAFKELFQTYRGELGSVTQRQLIKFITVGIANTLIYFSLYFLFTRFILFFSTHLLTASGVAFALATVFSFITNRKWTFRRSGPVQTTELVRFYITVGIALIINTISFFIFLRLFQFNDLAAVIAATIVTFAWNFTISKFWVFSNFRFRLIQNHIPRRDFFLLLAFAATTIIGMLLWLAADQFPPHWDMALHIINSLSYADSFEALVTSQSTATMVAQAADFFVYRDAYYPPFAYWTSVPFILFFGRSFDAAVYTNSFYVCLLIFSVYAIGRKLWDRKIGLLSALVITCYPFIASQFHEFQLDLPLLTMTALGFWFLLTTDRFQNPVWSFVFGMVSGLGLLTKWTYPAFLIGPVLVMVGERLWELYRLSPSNRQMALKSLILNVGLSLLGLLLVALPWYYAHRQGLYHNLFNNWEMGKSEGDPIPLTVAWLTYYLNMLLTDHIRLLMFIPLFVGLIYTFKRRDVWHKNRLLIAMAIGGYVIMTIYNNKDSRFIEPIMVSLSILSVYWVSLVRQPIQRYAVLGIIAVSLFQFLSSGWGTKAFPHLPAKAAIPVSPGILNRDEIPVWYFKGYTAGPPQQQNWHQEDLLKAIDQHSEDPAPSAVIYYDDAIQFNEENLRYYAMMNHYPFHIYRGNRDKKDCGTVSYVIARGQARDKVGADFPYYDEYRYENGRSIVSPQTYSAQPRCSLVTIYEDSLPDSSLVTVWEVKR